ncbi:MAG: signal peptide peptidase SppA [Deltaproteobacteria bacterium]|nr:signal peptide peptidase SppA [Deltaproteobacteria bacterium]
MTAVFGLFVGMSLGTTCARCGGLGTEIVPGPGSSTVGVVEVLGAITDGRLEVRRVRELARDTSIDAILVRIDSPGGAVAPSQEIFEALRQAARAKPVVASIGTVGASGGLWIALGADRIFASAGSITGSIGVITYGFDLRGLAEKLAVAPRVFRSGTQKDSGNPFSPVSPEEEASTMDLIADVYDQFVDTVASRRQLTPDHVRTFADGRIMSGRVARDVGLVDQLGGLYEAAREAAWLAESRAEQEAGRVAPERKPDDEQDPTLVYPKPPPSGLIRALTEDVGSAAGRAMQSIARELAGGSSVRVEAR